MKGMYHIDSSRLEGRASTDILVYYPIIKFSNLVDYVEFRNENVCFHGENNPLFNSM